jgi:hypothetical protein
MMDSHDHKPMMQTPEEGLAQALAREGATLASVPAMLRHLLLHDGQALLSEDVLARLRAMLADLAAQLVSAVENTHAAVLPPVAVLARLLPQVPGMLLHLHAIALEWQQTERLQERLGLDPVLSPLMQALVASGDGAVSARAMQMLAAQARFVQGQRRLQLPITELPAELLHGALAALHAVCGQMDPHGDLPLHAAQAEQALRDRYDEAGTRLGLLAQTVSAMGAGALAALAPAHAGVAIFATALAMGSQQSREMAVLAMQNGHLARLALSLRAAGLALGALVDAVNTLDADVTVPVAIGRLSVDTAARMLALEGEAVPQPLRNRPDFKFAGGLQLGGA